MEIAFSSSFKRAYKKRSKNNKDFEEKFLQSVEIFCKDPFDRQLRTHKLKGKLKDLWSFSIEFNLRVIFYFEEKDKKAIFTDIGSHDEVY